MKSRPTGINGVVRNASPTHSNSYSHFHAPTFQVEPISGFGRLAVSSGASPSSSVGKPGPVPRFDSIPNPSVPDGGSRIQEIRFFPAAVGHHSFGKPSIRIAPIPTSISSSRY